MSHGVANAKWLGACAAALLLAIVALQLPGEPAPSRTVTVATEPLALLLPHGHRADDTVLSPDHGVIVASLPVEIAETMWVTAASVETENAPFGIIHHLGLYRARPGQAEAPVFLTGQDSGSFIRFPAPVGVLLEAGDTVAIRGMLHNPVHPLGEGGLYRDVTIRVTLAGTGEDGRETELMYNQIHVSDGTATDEELTMFSVPKGALHATKRSEDNPPNGAVRSLTFTNDGWIVCMGAHMHAWEGGERVDAYLNGKRVRTFTSRLTNPDVPWSFRTESVPAYIRVRAGDALSVSTTYSNPTDTTITGAMGTVGFFYTQDPLPPVTNGWWTVKSWIYGALAAAS